MTLTFGSLFAGIGGIDLGLERAGMRCAWQVEIDDYAQRVLAKHWPDVARFRDVRECGAHNLAPVDVIAGGFPCQPHSLSGERLASEDERDLWPEFRRLICELKPRWVVAENVLGLLSSEGGRFFGGVLRDLAALGFDAEWQVLPAAAFGRYHLRERVFLVAYPHALRLEGRVFERPRLRVETLSEAQVWRDLPGPYVRGAPYGVSERMGRIGGLGNAVVPQVAEFVGRCIVAHAQEAAA